MKDYYRILQVAPTASAEVIRAAYEQLLLSEGAGAGNPRSEARLRELHDAFGVLGNPQRREAYDRSLSRGVGPGGLALLAAVVLIVGVFLVLPATRSDEVASGPAAASRTPEPPPVLPAVSPVASETPIPSPVVEASPSPVVEMSPSPLVEASPSPTASYPEVDGVFFFEDFSDVEVGYLPKYLPGMPDYMVDVDRERKFMRRFQETQGEASFLVEGVNFPKDYEIDWVTRVPDSGDVTCTAGQNQAGLRYPGRMWLNSSSVQLVSPGDRTVKFTLRKTGPLVRLLLDGQEVLLGRYPEPEVPPTAFSLTFSDDDWVLYLVRARRL